MYGIDPLPDYSRENSLLMTWAGPVCGIDEAGRGPLAGPVIAAAVILDPHRIPDGIDDSKKLTPERREELFEAIIARSIFGIGIADVARIDRDNILWASMWAMAEAVRQLATSPAFVLVDGDRLPELACPGEAIVDGDAICVSIAAASIIAKVTRDRLMRALHLEFPAYGFDQHKGYATPDHLAALAAHGPSPHHRKHFAPVAACGVNHS